MKKIFAVLMIVFLLPCISCKKEALSLTTEIWVTTINNSWNLTSVINYKIEEKGTEISASSSDDSIVKIQDEKMVIGDKFGTAKVTIETKKKKAVLEVKVVTTYEYLQYKIETETNARQKLSYERNLLAIEWLMRNIDEFNNPKSVEVLKIFAFLDEADDVDYFVFEIRAENKFGGLTTDLIKIKDITISEGTSPYDIYPRPKFTGMGTYLINKMLDEYKNGLDPNLKYI